MSRSRLSICKAMVAVTLLSTALPSCQSDEISAKIDAIRKEGYPETLAELERWYPRPSTNENGALVYLEAFSRYRRPWNDNSPKWKLLLAEGWAKMPARGEPLSQETKDLISEYLAANDETMRLLHKAAGYKHSRFPSELAIGLPDPREMFGDLFQTNAVPDDAKVRKWNEVLASHKLKTMISYLAEMRRGARLLWLEALLHAENNEPESAAKSIVCSMRLSHAVAQEINVISQLLRMATAAIASDSLERVLNKTPLTDSALADLQQALVQAEEPGAMIRAIAGDRCTRIEAFQTARAGQLTRARLLYLDNAYGGPGDITFLKLDAHPRAQQDFSAALDLEAKLLDAMQLPFPDGIEASKAIQMQREKLAEDFSISREVPDHRIILKDARHIALLGAVRTALGIERHRLATGKFPDALDELVPTYLSSLPADPFDGRPVRYKRTEKGFVVYSIGEDAEDNGGNETNSAGLKYQPGTDITFTVER